MSDYLNAILLLCQNLWKMNVGLICIWTSNVCLITGSGLTFRAFGTGGAQWTIALTDFGRSTNPISIRGANYGHQITARPSPGFLDLPTGLTLTYCLMMRGGRIYETAHTAVLKQKPVSLARNQPKKQKFTQPVLCSIAQAPLTRCTHVMISIAIRNDSTVPQEDLKIWGAWQYCSGHNLPKPMIGIGLTYQPKYEGGRSFPYPPQVPRSLQYIVAVFNASAKSVLQSVPASLCTILLTRQQNYFSPPHQQQ